MAEYIGKTVKLARTPNTGPTVRLPDIGVTHERQAYKTVETLRTEMLSLQKRLRTLIESIYISGKGAIITGPDGPDISGNFPSLQGEELNSIHARIRFPSQDASGIITMCNATIGVATDNNNLSLNVKLHGSEKYRALLIASQGTDSFGFKPWESTLIEEGDRISKISTPIEFPVDPETSKDLARITMWAGEILDSIGGCNTAQVMALSMVSTTTYSGVPHQISYEIQGEELNL